MMSLAEALLKIRVILLNTLLRVACASVNNIVSAF